MAKFRKVLRFLSCLNNILRESLEAQKIVQFIDGSANIKEFAGQLKDLLRTQVGLVERAIAGVWLKLYEEAVLLQEQNGFPPKQQLGNEPIAIIGIGCRLPGANNLEEFWNLLYEGEVGITRVPEFRWKREQSMFPAGEKEKATNAGFLTQTVDDFDAKFFGVSPKEAVYMDPQVRILHEVLWEALENGGVDPHSLYGSHTGIFTGSWMNDYKDIVGHSEHRDFFRTYMGNGIGAGAARLSFLLGLTGPCIATVSCFYTIHALYLF